MIDRSLFGGAFSVGSNKFTIKWLLSKSKSDKVIMKENLKIVHTLPYLLVVTTQWALVLYQDSMLRIFFSNGVEHIKMSLI